MSTVLRTRILATIVYCLLSLAAARVVWIPQEFDPLESRTGALVVERDAATCGGDTSLSPCGGDFPSNFCCPASSTCFALNTSSTVKATICCPAGRGCQNINTVSCDESLQNATALPGSQFHSQPPQKLETCANGCCPMGYACQSGQCIAKSALLPASSAAPSSLSAAPSPSSSTTPSLSSTATPAPKTTGGAAYPLDDPPSNSSTTTFNGKSFAAGFIPGIALGALIVAILLLLFFRKKRGSSDIYGDEKHRDTLTDLTTMPSRRPTVHGRSISEPTANFSAGGGNRTDFLRGTPPRVGDPLNPQSNYTVDVRSPASGPRTPADRTSVPKIRALFSRSPFMTQTPSTPPSIHPPIPAHLKRGTLSFTISPVRTLKKQRSMHSLRRQMTDASRGSGRRHRPDHERSDSTETIQVLMPSREPYTPERQRGAQHTTTSQQQQQQQQSAGTNTTASEEPGSASTEFSSDDIDIEYPAHETPDERQSHVSALPKATYASSSRYPSTQPGFPTSVTTPSPPPLPAFATTLGSPYTPTNQSKGRVAPPAAASNGFGAGRLVVPGEGIGGRRDTTFSALMERAGLRRSELVVGGQGKGR